MKSEKTNTGMAVGRNQVRESLRASLVEKVYIARGARGAPVEEIRRIARSQKVPVVDVPGRKIDDLAGTTRSQGVVAQLSEVPRAELQDILAAAQDRGEDAFIVMLDQVQDPHNLGAIIRSADAAGVHGVVITSRRSAGVNDTVFRTSAGAAAHIPVARVSNITDAIDKLKKLGIWVAGAERDGEDVLYDANLSGPIAVVIGGEDQGLRPSVRKHCDFTVTIPMKGMVNSLNASVAAGIIMFEVRRRRDQ